MKASPRTAPPNSFHRGDRVEVTYGARDGMEGVVANVVTDVARYQLFLVTTADGVSSWYGSDELAPWVAS